MSGEKFFGVPTLCVGEAAELKSPQLSFSEEILTFLLNWRVRCLQFYKPSLTVKISGFFLTLVLEK